MHSKDYLSCHVQNMSALSLAHLRILLLLLLLQDVSSSNLLARSSVTEDCKASALPVDNLIDWLTVRSCLFDHANSLHHRFTVTKINRTRFLNIIILIMIGKATPGIIIAGRCGGPLLVPRTVYYKMWCEWDWVALQPHCDKKHCHPWDCHDWGRLVLFV